MSEQNASEIGLYDIADWVWSYRILALGLFVVATVIAAIIWLSPRPVNIVYETKLSVFVSGTPVRTTSEIVYILSSKLVTNEATLISGPDQNPVVIRFSTKSASTSALETASSLEKMLLDEVVERLEATETIRAYNPTALAMYASAESFLAGTRVGLIDILEGTATETVSRSPPPTRNAIFALAGAGIAFVAIAGTHSFIRAWRERRLDRQR